MLVFNKFQTTDNWTRSKIFNNYGADGIKGLIVRNLGAENKAL